MKLLILVLGSNDAQSQHLIEEGVKKSYASLKFDNIRVMYYYGGKEKNEIFGDNIYLTDDDGYHEPLFNKTISAFKMVYENVDFDVLIRTNASTFWRPEVVYNILKRCELKDFYGSTHCHPDDKGCFAGVSLIMSRDVVKKILDNVHVDTPKRDWDDTGLDLLLRYIYKDQYRKNYRDFKRLDMHQDHMIAFNDPMFKIYYNDIWAFRVKTSLGSKNRELDVKKMLKLKEIFYG